MARSSKASTIVMFIILCRPTKTSKQIRNKVCGLGCSLDRNWQCRDELAAGGALVAVRVVRESPVTDTLRAIIMAAPEWSCSFVVANCADLLFFYFLFLISYFSLNNTRCCDDGQYVKLFPTERVIGLSRASTTIVNTQKRSVISPQDTLLRVRL